MLRLACSSVYDRLQAFASVLTHGDYEKTPLLRPSTQSLLLSTGNRVGTTNAATSAQGTGPKLRKQGSKRGLLKSAPGGKRLPSGLPHPALKRAPSRRLAVKQQPKQQQAQSQKSGSGMSPSSQRSRTESVASAATPRGTRVLRARDVGSGATPRSRRRRSSSQDSSGREAADYDDPRPAPPPVAEDAPLQPVPGSAAADNTPGSLVLRTRALRQAKLAARLGVKALPPDAIPDPFEPSSPRNNLPQVSNSSTCGCYNSHARE